MVARGTARIALSLAALGAVGLAVAAAVRTGPLETLDVGLARTLHTMISRHPDAIAFWRAVSTVGAPVVWDVLGAVLAVVLYLRRRFAAAAAVTCALVGAGLLSTGLKALVSRPRPALAHPVAHAAGMSFPSGHALTSCVAVGTFALFALPSLGRAPGRWLLAGGMIVVAAIGFSRLILGVHYLSDVIGAWLIGGLWIAAVQRLTTSRSAAAPTGPGSRAR